MSLADFKPEVVEIQAKGKTLFTVRGLSFFDISKIVRVHYHDLDSLFDLYEKTAGQDFTAIATGKFAVNLINDAPGIISHIIALAADEEDQLETVQKLGLMTQYDALLAIGRLTFSDVEEVKKIFAQVVGLVQKVKAEGQTPAANAK